MQHAHTVLKDVGGTVKIHQVSNSKENFILKPGQLVT